jgi:signal transduction histidine kinase
MPASPSSTIREAKEAAKLRHYVSELEVAKLDLENTAEHLTIALEAAAAASKAKSLFLAAMSHELRTPLNAIIGFSEFLKLGGLTTEERSREYVDHILYSGRHLLAVINDILDISKCEAGSLKLKDEIVDLSGLITSCLEIMAPVAVKAEVNLLRIVEIAPRVHADERRLRQILLNLFSNAIKFTPAGGEVRVSVSVGEDVDGVQIAVSDTGIGMREEDILRAFEPFEQIDSSLSRKYEGTGLGLPLAKKLAELHGGDILIASKPGMGTTATILLPASRSVARSCAA